MTKVLAGITMSLDGYITGPNDRLGAGLGDGGERLHHWVFGGPWTYDRPGGSAIGVDKDYIEEVFASGGAWIVGRTMHDVVDGWGDDPGFGVPVFVVTHREHETVVKGDTRFEFVTAGIAEAMERARGSGRQERDRHGRRRPASPVPVGRPRGRVHADDRAGAARRRQAPLRRDLPNRHRVRAHRGDRVAVCDPSALSRARRYLSGRELVSGLATLRAGP